MEFDADPESDGSIDDDDVLGHNNDGFEEESMEEDIAEDSNPPPVSEVLYLTNAVDDAYLHNLRYFDHEEIDSEFVKFILMDIDVSTNKQHGTIIQLFGRLSPSNKSINVTLSGWNPYFFIEQPNGWDHGKHRAAFALKLTELLSNHLAEAHPRLLKTFGTMECDCIMGIEQVRGTDIMGFRPASEQNKPFLKIVIAAPLFVKPLRECLENEDLALGGEFAMISKRKTFNSNLEPVLQFMVDKNISGCQWCQVPFGIQDTHITKTTCDIEVRSCSVDQLQLLELAEKSDTGSIRILSFDLEAAGRKGIFPDPAIDPVIQIGIQFQVCGNEKKTPRPILLSFKECCSIADADLFSFDDEASMLIAFRDIMVHFDPDVITGYNICNFDCDYLKKRAEALQIGSNFCSLTRMKEIRMDVREVTFESAQVGKRKSNKVSIKGRSVLDVYKWMKDNFSLEEYSLNAVSSKFLGDTKEDIHFTEITPKWLLGPETRRELGIYCLKDALLPLHLMDKLNITLNAIERARVTGLPCEWVLNRGMLVRFTSQLMRESNEKGYMLPYIDSESPLRRETTKYTGATVLDVERGLWTNVAVLDFSSMYPCQIIAENLCYCTYLGQHSWSPHDDLQVRPLYFQGHKFVNEKDRKGIIPCILERMLKQRKIAKAAFAQENDDPVKKLVLKARELSYKVVCNGIYGALGCKNALIPLRAIAETTTGLGRKDIQRVKEIAESMFTTSNGYAGNAKVVCGDTDSVFVSMPVTLGLSGMEAIAESMRFATLLADTVNAEMKSPKKIEPEKVFANILLMKKKRYAGLKYETLVDEPKIDIKGIECVRRDGCPLVRNLVRETVECLARTADVDAAAQLVRQMVDKVMSDSIPDEDYAIKKMLRKTIQDCAHPMTPQEVVHIRKAIDSDKTAAHLTEEEQDKAIRMGVKLRWRIFRKLPHIMVAWKLRQKDPGNAPVLGESVRYVISLNGGKQVSEKAEPLEFVLKGKILVDRHFYLASLRKAIDGIFSPIIEQRNPSFKIVSQQPDGSKLKSKEHHKKKEKMESDQFNKSVKKAVEDLLWRQLLEGKLSKNSEKQRAIVQQSPIMQAFMRASSKKPKGA